VTITLASRDDRLVPTIARGKGCRVVAGDERRLRVYVSATQAAEFLANIRNNKLISVTFSLPLSHRTLQFKGSDARVDSIQPSERVLMQSYADALAESFRPLGFLDDFARALLSSPSDEVAVEFSPTDVFSQTPGPNAGARLT